MLMSKFFKSLLLVLMMWIEIQVSRFFMVSYIYFKESKIWCVYGGLILFEFYFDNLN